MIVRQLTELGAMVLIGDGVLAMSAPAQHSLLWRGGPEWWGKLMQGLAERPNLVRALGAAEVGVGLGLALRQYPRR